ncbi:MAG: thiamine phosphate synthase [Acidobacteria bacterium]|nr:thiamine phosphate synthase [Acidobacteriota bacterium]
MRFELPPVYPITDRKLSRRPSHLSILKDLVRGGATLVQIRDKSTPLQELLRDLTKCVDFAIGKGVTLVVNDRCDLALSSGAMGVHLGQDDLPPDAARSLLGNDRIIGFSTHSSVQARRAFGLPIQYIGFGPVYETSTKDNPSPAVGIQRLRRICAISPLPVVAIGGIRLARVPEILAAGAASVAVISDLMKSRDLARRMELYLKKATER